ncbi:hypothetical protein, partial [Mesorhizobium sp. M7A.F.Ca.CA.003.01.2.1]|uniref:hypothetical protein n=1 Tax=Mesorhizobium sp. M7A.F.Ca.CA.003.01.2.1 TaxID=2496722 RepID=UPI0019CFA4FF
VKYLYGWRNSTVATGGIVETSDFDHCDAGPAGRLVSLSLLRWAGEGGSARSLTVAGFPTFA